MVCFGWDKRHLFVTEKEPDNCINGEDITKLLLSKLSTSLHPRLQIDNKQNSVILVAFSVHVEDMV